MRLIEPKLLCQLAAFLLSFLVATSSNAQLPTAITPQRLELKLQQKISATWQDQQLGSILFRIAETQNLTIWIDRRVNTGQKLELHINNQSLEQTLTLLAEKLGLSITLFDSIVFFGPKQAASDLQTLSKLAQASLDDTPARTKRLWLEHESLESSHPTTPKALLIGLLNDANLKISNPEVIPHDLWATKRLPPLKLIDQVLLITIGFDLTFQISRDGKTCELVPIEQPVVISQNYKLPPSHRSITDKLKREIPHLSFQTKNNYLSFTGRWEDHLLIQQLLGNKTDLRSKSSLNPPSKSEKRFSLQLQNQPVGAVINQLANQLKLVVTWNKASLATAKISQDTPVSCQVKNVSLDELLESILAPAGLQSHREANRIEIRAIQQ